MEVTDIETEARTMVPLEAPRRRGRPTLPSNEYQDRRALEEGTFRGVGMNHHIRWRGRSNAQRMRDRDYSRQRYQERKVERLKQVLETTTVPPRPALYICPLCQKCFSASPTHQRRHEQSKKHRDLLAYLQKSQGAPSASPIPTPTPTPEIPPAEPRAPTGTESVR